MQEQNLWGIVLAAGEGTRVRKFLQQQCGGRGIKQFSAVIGHRSMLEHTLARVERLIPERILVIVSVDHREEVAAQLAHWPAVNVTFQPENQDTAPEHPVATRVHLPTRTLRDCRHLPLQTTSSWTKRVSWTPYGPAVSDTQRFSRLDLIRDDSHRYRRRIWLDRAW